jgi:hypothetical protein
MGKGAKEETRCKVILRKGPIRSIITKWVSKGASKTTDEREDRKRESLGVR